MSAAMETVIEPTLVEIPPGTFVMGATEDDKFANLLERPRHEVRIAHRFALAAHLVTFAMWDAYCDATPEAHRPHGAFGRGDLPVAGVSWRDAVGYCAWLSDATGKAYRLPSEAEWEYACRAGTATVFHTGNDIAPAQCNYLYDELGRVVGLGRPTPVGSYAPNAFGLYDMHGNACELVLDQWHDGYADAPIDGGAWLDPAAKRNPLRVLRGGSWDYLPRLLRSAYRDWIRDDRRLDNVGFRLALDLDSSATDGHG